MFQSPLKTVAEKIKPTRSKETISSLRFERSSDFKKFIKFIKNQTEELEKIKIPTEKEVAPKSKMPGVLGLLGLGAFAFLGSLFGGDEKKDTKFRVGGAEASSIPFTPSGFSTLRPKAKDLAKVPKTQQFTKLFDRQKRKKIQKRAKQLRIRRDILRNFNVEEKIKQKSLMNKKATTPTKLDVARESELLENLKRRRIGGEIFDDTLNSDLRDIETYSKTGRLPGINPEVDQLFLDFEDMIKSPDPEVEKMIQNIEDLEKVGKFEKYTDKDFADAAERISKTEKDIQKTVNDIKNKLKEQRTPNLRIQKNFKFSLFGDKGFSPKDLLDNTFTKIGKSTKGLRDTFSKPFQGTGLSKTLNISKFFSRVGFGLDLLSFVIATGELIDGFIVGDNILTSYYDLGVAVHNMFQPDKTKLMYYITKSRDARKNAFTDKKNQEIRDAINKAKEKQGITTNQISAQEGSGGIVPFAKAATVSPMGITMVPTIYSWKFITEKLYKQ